MKKLMLLAAGLMLSALFSGCAGVQVKPVSLPIIPPAQLAEQFCPIVKADLDILSTSPLLSQAQKDKLLSVSPINDAVCSASATIQLTDLQSFNNTLFPAVTAIVAAVPAIPNQPAILLALQLAQPLLNQVVADAIAASKASAATASLGAVAASAPVAASQ
ncbi:hypothetical protein GCT13_08075 [Paraburkholderia sp. CNPSo 3157]|uniref:Lipoprotein n=1 Tax=Paraburkholderia franconis TaxID=2654983 RepID=A0A7X1TF82_9BURK|nr:hypothetical protein [Paraburkholderia franconis]MPW16889.1 hypothetical protein [Paraburkholderia franconis]